MNTPRNRSPWLGRGLLGVVVLLVGVWFGGHPSWLPSPVRNALVSQSSNDKLVDQVFGLLTKDYYRRVSRSQLVNQGLAAAVQSLGDPYSHYYDPAAYRSFQNQDNPHDSGIGIHINREPQGLLVVDAIKGSPAARAGLRHGDLIVDVGATSLAHRPVAFSAGLIQGRAGTRVSLTVLRGKQRHVVTLTRANVVVPVTAGRVLHFQGKKLGYVQLGSFTAGSGDQVRQQVQNVLKQGARGLILDLRGNGGGLLEEAVNVASVFIGSGVIVSTDGRAQPRQVYRARGNAVATSQPMVVLVDRGTASSAEIVSAALQQRGRAKVVGTRTYGKGVFQEIQPLSNGGALDFTVGEFFTPNGENLGGGGVKRGPGVKPDVYASTPARDVSADPALTAAERTVAAGLQ